MNTPMPYEPDTLESSRMLIETLQSPRLRAGGPSSSNLLNRALNAIKRDLLHIATESSDVSDQTRVLSLAAHAQSAGLASLYQGLQAQVQGMTANSNANRAIAELYGNALTVSDNTQTSCDVNPLFGQATLPAITRRSVLSAERGNERAVIAPQTSLSLCLQPTVTSSSNATAPADYNFGQDAYGVFALDSSEPTPWIIEDPTATPHMSWVMLELPGDVAGAYLCNELEVVPAPAGACSLVSVQADVVGQGWVDLDFSYLGGYNASTRSVQGLCASRLCFPESSIRRFRLGLWTAGTFGFSSLRVLHATYATSATLTVDFSSATSSPLVQTLLQGKDTARLGYLSVGVTGERVSVTLAPLGPAGETPVITSVCCRW